MPEDAAWTAGFWPGLLWLASAVKSDAELGAQAARLARLLEPRASDDRTHDLGFVFMPSCVLGAVISGNRRFHEMAWTAAGTLLHRFDGPGGYFRAWGDARSREHQGLTTIDALMNVAFVLWMGLARRDADAVGAARSHADRAIQNQVREDGSTAQVAVYDTRSGDFVRQGTHQGLSADSCWSRGQAWAIYGFALLARLSGDQTYSDAAARVADYFYRHLPADGLVPWDFADTGASQSIPDSSAMAIAAAGMLCLADARSDPAYRVCAERLLQRLIDHALVEDADNPAILGRGTFSLKLGIGVDEALIFGDFYFMDALARLLDQPFADYIRPAP
jgi:unsaturated chondroitin disaccharide hydrolase